MTVIDAIDKTNIIKQLLQLKESMKINNELIIQ